MKIYNGTGIREQWNDGCLSQVKDAVFFAPRNERFRRIQPLISRRLFLKVGLHYSNLPEIQQFPSGKAPNRRIA